MVEHATPAFLPKSLGEQMQIGLIVKDLNAALRFWTEQMKVGPFVIIEESLGDRRFIHRGERSDVQMSIALAYQGDTQVELITPNNSAPSPYKEFFDAGGEGMHHLAFYPDNYEKACGDLARAGFEEVCFIELPDGSKNVSYFNGPSHLGLMIEVVPMTPTRLQHYGGIKALADSWDGSRPVRRYKTRSEFFTSPDCQQAARTSQ